MPRSASICRRLWHRCAICLHAATCILLRVRSTTQVSIPGSMREALVEWGMPPLTGSGITTTSCTMWPAASRAAASGWYLAFFCSIFSATASFRQYPTSMIVILYFVFHPGRGSNLMMSGLSCLGAAVGKIIWRRWRWVGIAHGGVGQGAGAARSCT